MKRHEKVFLCVTTAILGSVVILAALDYLASRIIDLDSTKQIIQTMVSERTGGAIDYQRIEPSVLPRPGIELESVRLAVPGTAMVTARSVRLYPKILPLLWGQVIISKLLVKEPELAVNISELPETSGTLSSFWYVRKSIEAIIAPLSVKSPDLDVEIQNGQLDIAWDQGMQFHFRDLNTYLTSTGRVLNIRVSCRSNFSESIELAAKMDPDTLNVQGNVSLVKLRPAVLIGSESPSVSAAFGSMKSNLSFTFMLVGPKMKITNLIGKIGRSSFSRLNAEIDMSKQQPYVYITSASVNMSLGQVRQALISSGAFDEPIKSIRSINGTFVVTSARAHGPLFAPSAWKYHLKGVASSIAIDEAHLPGLATLSHGTLELDPEKMTFNGLQVSVLDTSLTMDGALSNYMKGQMEAEATLQGYVGADTVHWINETEKIPSEFRMNHSFNIYHGSLKWSGGTTVSIDTVLAVSDGPDLTLEAMYSPSGTSVKNLRIQDDVSDATIALESGDKELHLKFKGDLTERTVASLLPAVQGKGWIRGDFDTQMSRNHPSRFMAEGSLDGGDFVIPRATGIPLIVNTVSLSADKGIVTVKDSELELGTTRFSANGNIASSDQDFLLDMHVETGSVTWDDIEQNLLQKNKTPESEEAKKVVTPRIRGTVDVHAESFGYKRFHWTPVHAIVSLKPEDVTVNIPEAVICGISTPGSVMVNDGLVRLDFHPSAKKQKLKDSLKCLLGENANITGKFNFTGHIMAQGRGKELKRSLDGTVRFTARDGIIYHYPIFSRIFSIVNVLEVFRGRYDDIISKGFPYNSIRVKGDIKKGTLKVREASMDGSTMKIAGEGDIDLTNKDTDLTLIVSPLRVIDSIVERIPIIRDITAGTLISIAMKVTGKIDDPKMITLPPSAVGEGIVGMVRRLFELPFKLFEPEKTDKKRK